jgi:hypothetical protein
LRFIARAFDRETPMRQHAVVIGFELLGRCEGGLDADWLER